MISGGYTTRPELKTVALPYDERELSAYTKQQLRQRLLQRAKDQAVDEPFRSCAQDKAKTLGIERGIYLSVDLDFWVRGHVDLEFLRRVIRHIGVKNVAAAVEHHSILPHLRRFGGVCTVLVNLDTHSDLGGLMDVTHGDGAESERRLELHSGSWIDYVPWPVREEFVWAYPNFVSRHNGRCDDFSKPRTPFGKIRQRSLITNWDSQWSKLRRRFAQPPHYGIDLEQVRAASITLSPNHCGTDAVDAFKTLVSEFNLELLDVLGAVLERVEPKVVATSDERREEVNDLEVNHANPQHVLNIEWVNPPQSQLRGLGSYNCAPKTPSYEVSAGYCWSITAPTLGCLVRADGTWYDLESDDPEDGSQDRAICPSRLWKVVAVEPISTETFQEFRDPTGQGRQIFRVELAGGFVELHAVENERGAEGVGRRLVRER